MWAILANHPGAGRTRCGRADHVTKRDSTAVGCGERTRCIRYRPGCRLCQMWPVVSMTRISSKASQYSCSCARIRCLRWMAAGYRPEVARRPECGEKGWSLQTSGLSTLTLCPFR